MVSVLSCGRTAAAANPIRTLPDAFVDRAVGRIRWEHDIVQVSVCTRLLGTGPARLRGTAMSESSSNRADSARRITPFVALCCFAIAALHCTSPESGGTTGGSTTGSESGTTSDTGDEAPRTATTTTTDTTGTTSQWTAGSESNETGDPPTLDEQLAELLAAQTIPVVPLSPAPAQDPALVALGEALLEPGFAVGTG